ncbi:MAG: TetR family transcriptional regulator [Verrucomicrobiales bacterium]|nr:TetR family transcriptional regulator [Verrucomicrobiales bacterium]
MQAAEWVVGQQGAGHLTLEAVAERAGMSKGGLLYNFPTKEVLLKAMLSRLLERFDADQAAERDARPSSGRPAARLEAFVRAGFREASDRQKVSAALLAAGASDPRLLAPVRDWKEGHFRSFASGARHPMRVLMVMLAMDGLWLTELLGTSKLDPAVRKALMDEMLAFAESAV